MIRLLIIADDFTGALDTGIQFRGKQTALRFGQNPGSYLKGLAPGTKVLIIDAETRHLSPEEAAAVVGRIAKDAAETGTECIYKKTDSGLRGNIGSELMAVLQGTGGKALHFVPALPQLNRITKNGVQYIDGLEVADSVFGKDPFEPVTASRVADIIGQQTRVPVVFPEEDRPGPVIILHDAETVQDLEAIARDLKEQGETALLAGCAGFAQMLPELLDIPTGAAEVPELPKKLVTVCGSINPITLSQMDRAEQAGVPRLRLGVAQKLDDGWRGTNQWRQDVNAMEQTILDHPNVIVECDGLGDPEGLEACREKLGMDLEGMRQRISGVMGSLLKTFLEDGLEATWMVTGGDTLMAFMELADLHELTPICEYLPGVVLASVELEGKTVYLLTKSGGFGEQSLLLDLEQKLHQNTTGKGE